MILEKFEKIKKLSEQYIQEDVITISDLQEKEYNGEELSFEEEVALNKFRKIRVKKLAKKVDQEAAFHARFEYLRAISNLVDYRTFLEKNTSLI